MGITMIEGHSRFRCHFRFVVIKIYMKVGVNYCETEDFFSKRRPKTTIDEVSGKGIERP